MARRSRLATTSLQDLAAEILNRHLCGLYVARRDTRLRAGHVRQDLDPDRIRCRGEAQESDQTQTEAHNHCRLHTEMSSLHRRSLLSCIIH